MANKPEEKESINLADVSKQVEEMLANAKLEAEKIAEKIIADAKAQVGGELTEEQKQANEKRKAYWEEYVEVSLFKDNNKYKDDVFVAVNGETCAIQRGKKVKIKRKFADVLEKSGIQDFETSELIDRKSGEYEKSNL